MNAEALIEEGWKLGRPCVYLHDKPQEDTRVWGIWGGNGISPAPDGPYEHWLTFDGHVLPSAIGAIDGMVSVYANVEDFETGMVTIGPHQALGNRIDGLALFARPAISLPPIDVVFRFGSADVKQWLRENDWMSGDSKDDEPFDYNNNFPDEHTASEYLKRYEDQLPLYTGGAYAMLGGWNMLWPDGDWADLLDRTLILWTFENSEPWIEVFRDSRGVYSVIQRIT